MPKDLLFLNRITVGVSSILGHLYATADWKSIDREIRHDGPPTTELGRLEAAWRVRRGDTAGPAHDRRAQPFRVGGEPLARCHGPARADVTPSLVEHETIECPAELLLSARTRLGNDGARVKTLRERAVIFIVDAINVGRSST